MAAASRRAAAAAQRLCSQARPKPSEAGAVGQRGRARLHRAAGRRRWAPAAAVATLCRCRCLPKRSPAAARASRRRSGRHCSGTLLRAARLALRRVRKAIWRMGRPAGRIACAWACPAPAAQFGGRVPSGRSCMRVSSGSFVHQPAIQSLSAHQQPQPQPSRQYAVAQGLVRAPLALQPCCCCGSDPRSIMPAWVGTAAPAAGHPPAPPPPPAGSSALPLPRLLHREACTAFAPVPPPEHPTYDVYSAIDGALAEDAGDFGDISTNSTCGCGGTHMFPVVGAWAADKLTCAGLVR